jgi:hypothetical protein
MANLLSNIDRETVVGINDHEWRIRTLHVYPGLVEQTAIHSRTT